MQQYLVSCIMSSGAVHAWDVGRGAALQRRLHKGVEEGQVGVDLDVLARRVRRQHHLPRPRLRSAHRHSTFVS